MRPLLRSHPSGGWCCSSTRGTTRLPAPTDAPAPLRLRRLASQPCTTTTCRSHARRDGGGATPCSRRVVPVDLQHMPVAGSWHPGTWPAVRFTVDGVAAPRQALREALPTVPPTELAVRG